MHELAGVLTLQEDQRIPARIQASSEQLERPGTWDGEPLTDPCGMSANRIAIGSRIKHDQDQAIHVSVPLLERQSPIEGWRSRNRVSPSTPARNVALRMVASHARGSPGIGIGTSVRHTTSGGTGNEVGRAAQRARHLESGRRTEMLARRARSRGRRRLGRPSRSTGPTSGRVRSGCIGIERFRAL